MHLCLKIKEKDFYAFKGQHLGFSWEMEVQRGSEKGSGGWWLRKGGNVSTLLPNTKKGTALLWRGCCFQECQHHPRSPLPVVGGGFGMPVESGFWSRGSKSINESLDHGPGVGGKTCQKEHV